MKKNWDTTKCRIDLLNGFLKFIIVRLGNTYLFGCAAAFARAFSSCASSGHSWS